MPEKAVFEQVIQYVPFLAMTANGKTTLNVPRILEALIIGAVVGLMASYITVQKLEVKMEAMTTRISNLEKKTEKIYGDIYIPHIPNRGQ